MNVARRLLQAASRYRPPSLPTVAQIETLEALEERTVLKKPQTDQKAHAHESQTAMHKAPLRPARPARHTPTASQEGKRGGEIATVGRGGERSHPPPVSSKRNAFKQIQPSAISLARVAARRFSPKHTGRGAQLRQIEATIPALPAVLTADFKLPAKLRLLGASTNPETFVAEKAGVSEIAVVGRSNVGKSTLLNALTEVAPARTDDRPGVTRAVHVYDLLPKLRLVDLPGYGFAFGKPESKMRWTDILMTYLTTRKRLGRVLVLLDARHGLKEIDRDFLAFLEEHLACRYQIVLTKCDLVPLDDLARRLDLTCKELAERWPRALPEVLLTAARKKEGAADVRVLLMRLAGLTPQ